MHKVSMRLKVVMLLLCFHTAWVCVLNWWFSHCCQGSGLFVLCLSPIVPGFPYLVIFLFLIWLAITAPVLVLLDYVLCVYKSWVLPEPLSIHASFTLCHQYWFIDLLKRRIVSYLKSPASFLLHTPWQMNGPLRRRMTASEDALRGLRQAGRRLDIPHQRLGPPAQLQTPPSPQKLRQYPQPWVAIRGSFKPAKKKFYLICWLCYSTYNQESRVLRP